MHTLIKKFLELPSPVWWTIIPTVITVLILSWQNITIGFLGLHSIDEYIFHASIRHMLESLLSGNLSGLFGFGFYQYGFIYFFINMLVAAPGILTDTYPWAIIAPRLVTGVFAIASLYLLYRFARIYVSEFTAALFGLLFITLPAFWYNATWFHPDWVMTFFLIGCAYYLARDNWEYNTNFTKAIIFYGLALAFKYQALTALPLLVFYIIGNKETLTLPKRLMWATKKLLIVVVTSGSIFLMANPYILHPMGWNAFSTAFTANMASNATNHGSASAVTIVDKINLAVGDYYLNIIFLFILIIGSLVLCFKYFSHGKRTIFSVIALNFLINFGYLLFFVNKAWQMYYLPVMILGLLTLLYFLKGYLKRNLALSIICLVQVCVYGLNYKPILSIGRDATAPDYTTYTSIQNTDLNNFLIKQLAGKVDDKTKILLTPYTPFSFDKLGLEYEQVDLIFGPLTRDNLDADAYLRGQKNYWGDLKSEEELMKTFSPPSIIIIRKNIPFFLANDLSGFKDKSSYENAHVIINDLYAGVIGYSVLAENDLVVIFNKTKN